MGHGGEKMEVINEILELNQSLEGGRLIIAAFLSLFGFLIIHREDRKNALNSSWIKRLFPIPQPLTSMLIGLEIPQMPPPPPPPHPPLEEGSGPSSCQPLAAFGPFQVPNVRESKLVDGSSSRMECKQHLNGGGWKGPASRDGADDCLAARRNLYKPVACNIITPHLYKRRTSPSSEAEEPFSYWNMGRLERANFVSSARPVSYLASIPSRKRTANAHGFISSKFARFCIEN